VTIYNVVRLPIVTDQETLPVDHRRRMFEMQCPLWVKSRHTRRNKSCPPYSQLRLQKRIFALRHVRFTPESGHVRCKGLCLLWAKSGHAYVNLRAASRAS
jgi:hypothetical protein